MEKTNIIYGIRPLLEALTSNINLDKVMIDDRKGMSNSTNDNAITQELKAKLKECDVRIQYVPTERLNRITNGNHQGVVAYISPISYAELEDVLADIKQRNGVPFILILDKITDVRNFGAIVRTAAAANVDCVVIPRHNAAAINEDAIKTSAGGLLKVQIVRADNLKTIINTLHQEGVMTICASEKAKENYTTPNYQQPLAIILGSEDKGIEQNILRLAQNQVSIPIKGEIESLNVSVAAGILIYEVLRQRLG
ncbi:MAG: 23S rRNA (guanosine(2251)-2'-O)-methyltransferase RlmB [Bacteroidales bacterium]|jgi:23S rRNA (guanosine2251-2'-O)-methyltransferase|nr:23S rRNA (guanosine(2251)-2'-O)-methyltransferase RlmB [Bacteroidales bacterium]